MDQRSVSLRRKVSSIAADALESSPIMSAQSAPAETPGAAPDVVLLDEPRNSLDAEGAEMLHASVREVLGPTGEQLTYEFDARYLLSQGQLTQV
jgi:hypothetical protein